MWNAGQGWDPMPRVQKMELPIFSEQSSQVYIGAGTREKRNEHSFFPTPRVPPLYFPHYSETVSP
jgi:hypothetical protein